MSVNPGAMGMYCPRSSGCIDPDEIVYSGFVLQEATGGNIPNIEDKLFYDQETKSSWTVVAFGVAATSAATITAAAGLGYGALDLIGQNGVV